MIGAETTVVVFSLSFFAAVATDEKIINAPKVIANDLKFIIIPCLYNYLALAFLEFISRGTGNKLNTNKSKFTTTHRACLNKNGALVDRKSTRLNSSHQI